MRWWPNIAFRIVSRRARIFSVSISMKSSRGRAEKTRAEKTNDLRDRCCYHAGVLLVAATLKENTMSVYKRGKKGTHWHYYFRVRGIRYRGVIAEARTKKQAEQAESKIKQEIFEGRFGLVNSGTMKLAKFIDEIYMPWAIANKRSWKGDQCYSEVLKDYFKGKSLCEI